MNGFRWVEGDDRPSYLDGTCQDIRIVDATPRHPRFLDVTTS